jgi:hypothetical protein
MADPLTHYHARAYFQLGEDKKLVAWYNSQLAMVVTIPGPMDDGGDEGGGRGGGRCDEWLKVYDLRNSLVTCSHKLPSPAERLFCEWGSVFVHLADGRLLRLTEKDTSQKLAVL